MCVRGSPRGLLFSAMILVLVLGGCVRPETEPAADPVRPWAPVGEARLTPEDASASEVSIAADPTDPAHLVAAANSGGGFGVYETRDAGGNWTATRFTAAEVDPANARFRGLSDPVVAFGPDGALYLAGLAYLPSSGVFVAVSKGGTAASWDSVHVVHESDLATSFNDKEWLAVDPVTGTLVLAWQKEQAMDQLRGIEAVVDDHVDADIDFGDIVVARSTDHGATWSEPHKVSRGGHNNGTQVAWTPDGRAHLLWVNYEEGALDFVSSDDAGETWSDPKAVADVQIVPAFPRFGRMHTLPAMVASPVGDRLYAVWHDKREGDADIFAVASPDGGATWTEPVRVNQDPRGNGAIQFYPWAAVDLEGRLHVAFYDARDDPHPRFLFRHAVAAGPELRFEETGPVSSEAFTAFAAPDGSTDEARSLGDYTGLAATSLGVFPAWADGRTERSGIHAVRLMPAE